MGFILILKIFKVMFKVDFQKYMELICMHFIHYKNLFSKNFVSRESIKEERLLTKDFW